MTTSRQVSAMISAETKELLERYARAHGLKKGHLIESALLHHISALESLPADVVVPPRLVVSRKVGQRILKLMAEPGEPTAAIEKLFEDGGER